MNIFLLECSASHWIPCVKRLAEKGIHVSLWTSWNHLKSDILTTCPNVIFQDTRDAKIGHAAIRYTPNFDSVCEAIWQEDAATLYEMMSRFDHGRDLINIDMSLLAYRLLAYWRFVLEQYRPELVIFSAPPHVVYDFIVLRLCQKLGIPTLMFEEATLYPPYSISMTHYQTGSERLAKAYETILSKKDVEISESINKIFKRIRSDYSKAIPPREAEVRKSLDQYDDVAAFSARREAEIASIETLEADPNNYYDNQVNKSSWIKQRGVELRHSFTAPNAGSSFHKQLLDEQLLTLNRKKFYNSLVTDLGQILSDERPMVYLSMAGQPERTSCPQSGIFSNQFLVVSLLSQYLPEDWRVVVKEHPNQFHPGMYVNMCRSQNYYETMAALPRTYLVSSDAPQFDLLDKASVAATTGGTIALEAVIRGRPVLVFGSPWYQACRGMTCVKTVVDAVRVIQNIKTLNKAKQKDVKLFFAAIPKGGFKGIADLPPPDFDIGDNACGQNLAKEIAAHMKSLQPDEGNPA